MTLADDDTNSIIAYDANRAIGVDGCHLIDGGRAQRGLGDHQVGRQGGWWYRSSTEYWSWCAVIMLATIYVVGTLPLGNGCH